MKDEIKEIKENIKPTLEWLKECSEYNWIFETSNSSELLNYITNLQEENEHFRTQVNTYENPDDYTLFYMWLDSKAKDKMKQLQEENEIKTTKLNAIRKYLLNNKLYTFKYDDEELFEITTDKKAKDDLLNILDGVDEQ